jgi:hypothetical protein
MRSSPCEKCDAPRERPESVSSLLTSKPIVVAIEAVRVTANDSHRQRKAQSAKISAIEIRWIRGYARARVVRVALAISRPGACRRPAHPGVDRSIGIEPRARAGSPHTALRSLRLLRLGEQLH